MAPLRLPCEVLLRFYFGREPRERLRKAAGDVLRLRIDSYLPLILEAGSSLKVLSIFLTKASFLFSYSLAKLSSPTS